MYLSARFGAAVLTPIMNLVLHLLIVGSYLVCFSTRWCAVVPTKLEEMCGWGSSF
jgi:hypothetical protein